MSPRRNTFVVALVLLVSVPITFGKGKTIECHSSALPSPGYFVDPTATKRGNVDIRSHVYVAPFAVLDAERFSILVDEDSDVQDSVHVDASAEPLVIGKKAILAHGASVKSNPNPKIPEFHPAIGIGGTCHGTPPPLVCPSFVGFNAEVDGGIVQLDAMVGALARVGPGVTIPSGRKVKPGKNVTSDADVMALTDPVTDGDRDFMNGVIDVNVALAKDTQNSATLIPLRWKGSTATHPLHPFQALCQSWMVKERGRCRHSLTVSSAMYTPAIPWRVSNE